MASGLGGFMKISKFASMTIGLVLILAGAQLYLVKSYLLTPAATRFFAEHFSQNQDSQFSAQSGGLTARTFNTSQPSAIPNTPGQSWPYYPTAQTGNSFYGGNSNSAVPARFGSLVNSMPPGHQQRFVPPQWFMWPALFIGVVLFLHGLALKPTAI